MTSWNIDFYAIDQSRETCTEVDTLYEYISCIWPSFVYHSRLTICDCLRFTKVCFAPTHQKNSFVWMTLMPVLCHVSTKINVFVLLVCSKLDWHRTLSLDILAVIATRFRQSGNSRDRRRSGRPRGTQRRQDNHIRLVDLLNHCKKHPRITTDQL
jgi:hypothetical protein